MKVVQKDIVISNTVTERVYFYKRQPDVNERKALLSAGFNYSHGTWSRTNTTWVDMDEADLLMFALPS